MAWTDKPFAVEGLAFLLCLRCFDTLEKIFENLCVCVCGLAHIHEGTLISGSRGERPSPLLHTEPLTRLITLPRLAGSMALGSACPSHTTPVLLSLELEVHAVLPSLGSKSFPSTHMPVYGH